MRILITSNPITAYGEFTRGDILNSKTFPVAFLAHLVDEAGAAEYIDRETKVDDEYEAKKKTQSSPSLPQAKALPKKTVKKRTRKAKQSS